jgi:hypothetical protein
LGHLDLENETYFIRIVFQFLTYRLELLLDDVVIVDGHEVMDGVHLEEGDVVVVVIGDKDRG